MNTADLDLSKWVRARVVPMAVALGGLVAACSASAAQATAEPGTVGQFPLAQVFTFLFLMLGPFKIIGPFSKITQGADAALTLRIALLATGFASLALVLAALLGERMLQSYGIPVPVLALSGGVILFLVALQTVLEQFASPAAHGENPLGTSPTPTVKMALTPLAFPTIVTPYGIAALVVFLALSQSQQAQLTIGAVLIAIMVLNLIVMVISRHILPVLGLVLPILGAVLGVVQVALGLQIIHNSLKALGIL
jgi:multiple antibiotic resistance protein